jgi:hypothetical protein
MERYQLSLVRIPKVETDEDARFRVIVVEGLGEDANLPTIGSKQMMWKPK